MSAFQDGYAAGYSECRDGFHPLVLRLRSLNGELREALLLSIERLEALDDKLVHGDVINFCRAVLAKSETSE